MAGACYELRGGSDGFGDSGEGKVLSQRAMPLPPRVEEPSVTERNVFCWIDAQPPCHAVDPLRRAFELGKVADRRLVHHAVAFAILPFGAPLFVVEGWSKPNG